MRRASKRIVTGLSIFAEYTESEFDTPSLAYRQHNESVRKMIGREDEEDDESDDHEANKKIGIFAIAERYHSSANRMSRAELLEECNAVIQAYEDSEEEKKRAQEVARLEADEDGFVTVSYSAAVGSKNELDESMDPTSHSRRKGNKRSRGNKKVSGSEELTDFYRFQRRDNRKRSLEDLRTQFKEDLKRVKRMKEDRQYRPF
jgi:ribosomal RNA-processing protein 7